MAAPLTRWSLTRIGLLAVLVALVASGIALQTLASQPHPAAAQQAPTVQVREGTILGSVLANADGFTLYTHDGDGPDASACDAQCALVFPPLLLAQGSPTKTPDLPGSLSVFTRDDGSRQVAHNQQPLYLYSGDLRPGDTNGEGVDGVWHAARPEAVAAFRSTPVASVALFHFSDSQTLTPVSASIAPGGTVIWENDDPNDAHDVACVQDQSSALCPWIDVLPLPSATFDACGDLVPSSESLTFTTPGLYTFTSAGANASAPQLSGQIIVGAPAAPAASGPP